MLSGRLPHAIEAWDNAAEMPAAIPTLMHYLRRLRYRTTLAGKMHFVGPDFAYSDMFTEFAVLPRSSV